MLPGWLVGHIIIVLLTESYTSIHKGGGEHRISIIRNLTNWTKSNLYDPLVDNPR
ncbi:hypothetical protein NARC_30246 [Candidatus Nitrosocosmicus arcticus]|uniref:Uncharacterized protein n=1 Tax=Candidatus Nitrosocosmicus arcticus TaxID=2035267 RepID=A0A557SY56_9ARCH|nr:hypothetical protein NARC_30246 [Candidatus Nitrosocosmicus arcticus]